MTAFAMKRLVSAVLLVLAASVHAADGARQFEAAVAADAECAMGLFMRYRFDESRETPPPDGYSPFYVSHYGRHGCRYQQNARQCGAADVLERVAAVGALTKKGEALLGRLRRIRDAHVGMWGELAELGAREHRALARRMLGRFPKVFSDGGRVRCRATTYSRCQMSMANFACEMKGLAPKLEFDFAAGERSKDVLLHAPDDSERLSADIEKARGSHFRDMFDPKALVGRLVADSPAAQEALGDPYEFAESLFYMAAACRPLSVELAGLETYDAFTLDELVALGRFMNAKWYMGMGNSAEFGARTTTAARKLAEDFAARADEAISRGGIAADLRFGHDSGLWPFVGLVGLEGVGDRVPYSEVCEHPALWRDMTMAANVQMAFYRNKTGDVLVKVLYNEKETPVRGLEPVSGAYYRWSDLKSRLVCK